MNTNYISGRAAAEARMVPPGPGLDGAGTQSESSALFDQIVSAHHRLGEVRETLHRKVTELFGPRPLPDTKPVPEPQGQLQRITVAIRSVHEQIDFIHDLVNDLRRL